MVFLTALQKFKNRHQRLTNQLELTGDCSAITRASSEGKATAEPPTSGGRGSRRAGQPREGEAPAEPANLGRARLLPSRPTLGGRGSCRAGQPREGEAPAEPANLGRARLPPSRRTQTHNELFGSAGASPSHWDATQPPSEGEAPAEPQDANAQQALRLSRSFALPKGRNGTTLGRARLPPSRRMQTHNKLFGSAGASPSHRDATQPPSEGEAPAEPQDANAQRTIRLSRSFALPQGRNATTSGGRGSCRAAGCKRTTSYSAQQELRPPEGTQCNNLGRTMLLP